MKDKSNAPYFGFLESVSPRIKKRAGRRLSGTSICRIGTHIIASDVVEEIVKRGGTFYTADEARSIAPFSIMYDDVFVASFKNPDSEPAPPGISVSGFSWCALTVYQYSYGIYLQKLIRNGTITLSDLEKGGD